MAHVFIRFLSSPFSLIAVGYSVKMILEVSLHGYSASAPGTIAIRGNGLRRKEKRALEENIVCSQFNLAPTMTQKVFAQPSSRY